MACILGVLLVVFPEGAFIQAGSMAFGVLVHNELLTTLGLICLPMAAQVMGYPDTVVVGCVALAVLTLVKRVEANRTPLPQGRQRWLVIWRRIWFDRDVPSHEEWLKHHHGG